MASAIGIKVPILYTAVFMFGAWLLRWEGACCSVRGADYPGMGEAIIIEAFVVVVIGGLGSLRGAF